MAVYFKTDKPKTLLKAFKKAVENDEITTWEADSSGDFFTHKAPRWAKKMWFKPVATTGKLVFKAIPSKNKPEIDRSIYAFYHGHLIETFINHFSSGFNFGVATPSPVADDNVKIK